MDIQKEVLTCPVGLVYECGLVERVPERRDEIVAHAIRVRERERLYAKEIRGLLSFRPYHAVRVAVIVGLVAFALAFLVSALVAIGRWYVGFQSSQIVIPIPVVGDYAIPYGSLAPSSTMLGVAGKIPAFGIVGAAYVGFGIMFAILLEQAIVAVMHRKESRTLKEYSDELKRELEVLRSWNG